MFVPLWGSGASAVARDGAGAGEFRALVPTLVPTGRGDTPGFCWKESISLWHADSPSLAGGATARLGDVPGVPEDFSNS